MNLLSTVSKYKRLTVASLALLSVALGTIALPGGANAAITDPAQIKYGTSTMASCSTVLIKPGYRGDCGKVLQKRLQDLGYYSSTIDGIVGKGTLNGVLNYQRAQGLYDDAYTGSATWAKLRLNPQPAIKDTPPSGCFAAGRVACVSVATRQAKFYQNGTLVKTIAIRTGGWTDQVDGTMRVHRTAIGSYSVYAKYLNPYSDRYGANQMPLSTAFDPNMYFHYSSDFAKIGYMGASHGCVNIRTMEEAQWVYDWLPVGAKVHVYTAPRA